MAVFRTGLGPVLVTEIIHTYIHGEANARAATTDELRSFRTIQDEFTKSLFLHHFDETRLLYIGID